MLYLGPRTGVSCGLAGLVALLTLGTCQAGTLMEWDLLPPMKLVRFEPLRVLLGTAEGQCLALHRGARSLRPVKCNTRDVFRSAERPPMDLLPGGRSGEVLVDSDGTRWTVSQAYCSEGIQRATMLWRRKQAFRAEIDPCHGVSAVEAHGDRVFLGTSHPGELATAPGEGLVVQHLETGEVLGRLAEKDGLTGDLIRQIRFDPLTGSIWVFSQWGYNRIDDELRILETGYFQVDFAPVTGKTRVVVVDRHAPLNVLAVVAERMALRDRPGFARAARSIPRAVLESLAPWYLECSSGGLCMPGTWSFLPDDFRPLVPFFLEAAAHELLGGGKRVAFTSLCAFHDRRVLDFMHRQYGDAQNDEDWQLARSCIEKYNRGQEARDLDPVD